MDKIYVFLSDVCHIDSVALTIVIFTIFIYICLFPLTYNQQKFSILSKKMQPELSAIQAKYKGKKDQVSMQAQQEEMQSLYDKYGVSQMGSCVQLIIQMPILFALYRVFYNVPAYITSVKDIFTELVDGIMSTSGYADLMQTIYDNASLRAVSYDATATGETMSNSIIDVLYKLSDSGWDSLASSFPNLSDSIATTYSNLADVNYLYILNISDTPWNLIKEGWSSGQWLLLICAILVPASSFVGQLINMKLMPTANNNSGNEQADQMAQQMKTMNTMMPLMTLYIGFICPVGLVIYWTVGSFVRIVQQYLLNKHFEKMNLDDIIEKNKEKAAKKKEKRGIRQAQIYQAASMSTKNRTMADKAGYSNTERDELISKSETARSNAKAGSMAAKANLVKDYNERNNR